MVTDGQATCAPMLSPPSQERPIRWGFVVVLTLLFTFALNLWVERTELLTGASNLAGGNPPVPVLLWICLLVLLRQRLRLTDAELILLYLLAVFVFIPTTLGGVRAFFPALTTPFYYANPENQLKEFWQLLPDWWVPKEAWVIKGFFEGREGKVPLAIWLPFLLRWSVFFFALWAIGWGTAWLLAQRWLMQERLNFPLAQLPLHMVKGNGKSFFTSPLVWTGIACGALPTGLMVICSFFRPVQRFWDLSSYITERPFNTLAPLLIYPLMEGIGFGYFVPQDVLLSTWLGYASLKAMSFFGMGLLGWQVPGFPFPTSQSCGGFLIMAALLLWKGFRQRGTRWQKAAGALLSGGSVVMLGWMVLSGMSFPLAMLYFWFAWWLTVTYIRVRSEVGMPYTNVYPYGAQREFLSLFGLGFQRLMALGDKRSLVILVGLFWVVRYFFLFLNGAYAADAVKLAMEERLPLASLWAACGASALFGLWAAFLSHLRAYYRIGANFFEGAPGTGDYRTYVAAQDYRVLGWSLNDPSPFNRWQLGFTVYGTFVPCLFAWLRKRWTNSPLHPLGFILGVTYGHHCPYWFPTLTIWLVKGLILHYGGMNLHRRLVPFFLGLALGHYLMAGILWGGIFSPIFKDRWRFPFRIIFQ